MEVKYNLLYETKNLINGKVYRGVHCTNNLDDGYLGSGDRLKRAITKYGRDNFKRTDLQFFNSFDEALKGEASFVDINFISRSDVYNINLGGDCPPSRKGCKMSEDAKNRISKAMLGRKRSRESVEKTNKFHLGSKRSEESKIKMRLAHLGKPSGRKGIPLSAETRLKISLSNKGRTVWNKGITMLNKLNITKSDIDNKEIK
jgi:hypothetical protein